MKYINESKGRQKVYTDGVTGPFTFLEPGESCTIRLDADQEPRILDVKPEPKPKAKAKAKTDE